MRCDARSMRTQIDGLIGTQRVRLCVELVRAFHALPVFFPGPRRQGEQSQADNSGCEHGVSPGRDRYSKDRDHQAQVCSDYHPSHAVAGGLFYEGLALPADPGWHLYTFTAASGSPSDDRLRLLSSWAATLEHENTDSPSANADASENACHERSRRAGQRPASERRLNGNCQVNCERPA